MQKTSTRGTVYVANGTTAELAVPCYYMEIHRPVPAEPHDRLRHDMLGWPTPDRPDLCCQEWDFANSCCRRTPHMACCPPHCEHFVDMRRLFPIHLKEEGYTEFSVAMVGAPSGLTATASLDESDDWVVRMGVEADVRELDDPKSPPKIVPFSLFAIAPKRRDLVFTGRMAVIANPAPRKE